METISLEFLALNFHQAFQGQTDEQLEEAVSSEFALYGGDDGEMTVEEYMIQLGAYEGGFPEDLVRDLFDELNMDNSETVTIEEALAWAIGIRDASTEEL